MFLPLYCPKEIAKFSVLLNEFDSLCDFGYIQKYTSLYLWWYGRRFLWWISNLICWYN